MARALTELNIPQTQLLVAAAMLAQQVHGPFAARAAGIEQWPMFETVGGGRYDAVPEQALDPIVRAVSRARTGAHPAPRSAVRTVSGSAVLIRTVGAIRRRPILDSERVLDSSRTRASSSERTAAATTDHVDVAVGRPRGVSRNN